jgi:endoglucanase
MEREENKKIAVQLLRKLTEAHGASGSEGEIRRIFRRELGEGTYTDGLGSIIMEKKGSAETPKLLLAAHMDEVGFMVQAITSSGRIKFVPLGGWWAHTLPSMRVRILTQSGNKVVGVIGAKPPHFLSDAERDRLQKLDDMFIDVGASSGAQVREQFGIELGDSIVPDTSFTPMHNPDMLLGKGFDNRAGMALLIHAIKMLKPEEHPNRVWAVATVQEEVGVRGAQTAVSTIVPDVAVVLEGAPADDLPGIAEDERQGVLGGGVQIRIMDPTAIMNRKLVNYVTELAGRHGIKHQVTVRRSGGTDARAIQMHGRGIPTVVLSVPARYIHTQNGIINLEDYLSTLDLASRLLRSLDSAAAADLASFDD